MTIGVRPEHLGTASAPAAGAALLQASVQLVEHLGDVAYVHAKTVGGMQLTARATEDTTLSAGDPVLLSFAAADALVFDADGRALRRPA